MTVYVQRDSGGSIIGLYANPQRDVQGNLVTDPEPVSVTDPDVVVFLARAGAA